MPVKERRHPAHDEPPAAFSSPPCYAHEIDPAYLGFLPALDLETLHATVSTLEAAIADLRSLRFP